MKLGGLALHGLFASKRWKAYRGDDPLPIDELERLTGPNSIDVTLGGDFIVFDPSPTIIDPVFSDNTESIVFHRKHGSVSIAPHQFMLGSVRERFDCSAPVSFDIGERNRYFATRIDGRSTVGRLGLLIHVTAGYGDYGFQGAYTLEIVNLSPNTLILHPGMRIGQVSFEEVVHPKLYEGAYSTADHNNGPVFPRTGPGRF